MTRRTVTGILALAVVIAALGVALFARRDPGPTAEGISYRPAPSAGLARSPQLDIYAGAAQAGDALPVVVLFHPGAFVMGDRTDPVLVRTAKELVGDGYVAVLGDYRLRPGWSFSLADDGGVGAVLADAHDDAIALYEWVRSNIASYGGDPARIAVLGRSAGAMLAIASSRDGVRAVVSSSGCAVGGTTLDASSAPVLMIHGTDDPVVPYECAQRTMTDGRAAGARVDLVGFDGVEHVPERTWDRWYTRVVKFLDATV